MVPIEIRKIAFRSMQELSRMWIGKKTPDFILDEIKLLETIAYIDGVADLRESREIEEIKNPINFTVPASENSTKNREIKTSLHNKGVEINTEIVMSYLEKNPKVIAKLIERKSTK